METKTVLFFHVCSNWSLNYQFVKEHKVGCVISVYVGVLKQWLNGRDDNIYITHITSLESDPNDRAQRRINVVSVSRHLTHYDFSILSVLCLQPAVLPAEQF